MAYLTMADPGDFVMDYALSFPAMQAEGLRPEEVPWRRPGVDWDDFAAVYICTPWDYPRHMKEFLAVLERIEASRARLVNDLALVHRTLGKTYLRDIEAQGGAIVPSLWRDDFRAAELPGWFAALESDRVVVKPVVGANAVDTFLLEAPVDAATREVLATTFAGRPFFVQPFVESVPEEGEYSLFFFGGDYSHAIRKVPAPGDFRSQEEYGAEILPWTADPALVDVAARLLAAVDPEPVYVRADFVRGRGGEYLLMELELIEPALYFRTDAGAAARFAAAFARHLGAAA